jgi:NADPH-dependent 2,4-dienoyl-CoA reductase/sulfur reductase-like enzyme
VAPSPIPSQFLGIVPRELDQEKIDEIQNSFAACAERAMISGFDGVEIHGGNGYLLTEFLSPRLNQRKDKYGGVIENRARMALEIYEKIRAVTFPGFLVGYRICADEHMPGGITQDDVAAFVRMLEKAGINYISVTAGTYESNTFGVPTMYVPRGSNLHLAELIKRNVKVPVMCAGGLNAELGEIAIQEGKTDLVALGRSLIADPELPLKLMENRSEDIRPCVRGNQGCISRTIRSISLSCEVNPGIGRQTCEKLDRVQNPKKVMVLGGGVAGMESARLAAQRGHQVTLVEKTSDLGGHVIEASVPQFKQDLRPLLKWLRRQLAKEGVIISLDTEATPELVLRQKPDVVITALGSKYTLPSEELSHTDGVLFPDQILLGHEYVGEQVVVAGGGFVGCETAIYIAEELKKKVTIVEALDGVLKDCDEPMTMMSIMMRLQINGIEIRTGLSIGGFSGKEALCRDGAGSEISVPAESLVVATGLRPRIDDVMRFEGVAPQTFSVGDCVRPGKIYDAMHAAWRTVFSF